MLTSITPGSGVTLMCLMRAIVRRRVAFDQHRHVAAARRCLRWRRPVRCNLPPHRRGGMKTCRRPSRGSTHSAVRTIQGADSPTRACGRALVGSSVPSTPAGRLDDRARRACGNRQRPRSDHGIGLHELSGMSFGVTHGRLGSGSRKPIGESPGIRNRCCPRSIHSPVCHSGPDLPAPRCSGSTYADRRVRGRARTLGAAARALRDPPVDCPADRR